MHFNESNSMSHTVSVIVRTLTAIVFIHYRVATKMALEISGYTMCRVRQWWLVSLPLKLSKLVYAAYNMLDWRGWSYFSMKSTVRVLHISYMIYDIAWYVNSNRQKSFRMLSCMLTGARKRIKDEWKWISSCLCKKTPVLSSYIFLWF